MEPRPALILAQICHIAYTAQKNRALIDPETLLRIIREEGKS